MGTTGGTQIKCIGHFSGKCSLNTNGIRARTAEWIEYAKMVQSPGSGGGRQAQGLWCSGETAENETVVQLQSPCTRFISCSEMKRSPARMHTATSFCNTELSYLFHHKYLWNCINAQTMILCNELIFKSLNAKNAQLEGKKLGTTQPFITPVWNSNSEREWQDKIDKHHKWRVLRPSDTLKSISLLGKERKQNKVTFSRNMLQT